MNRRELLRRASCGFGYLALAGMCGAPRVGAAAEAEDPLAPKSPHFAPRAKRVIFLFMQGGPSHIDTFDPKPLLTRDDGQEARFYVSRTMRESHEKLLGSPWKFAQYGQSGRWVSELLPQITRHVDDLCFIRGMHTEGVAHGPSTLMLHTGAMNLVRPSMGAWVVYGLGTENDSLPGFVTIAPSAQMGGPRNYASAFLPPVFQATKIGRAGIAARNSQIEHLTHPTLSREEQRRQFDFVRAVNQEQLARESDARLEAVAASFELAFRMQREAPQVMSIEGETAATLSEYGIGKEPTDDFGRQCLLARRLAEAGVRFIQVNYADNSSNPRWDQHSNLKKHEFHAQATDRPVAALLADLKRRGLLEDTLVWWGGEFGRTPFAQGRDGRDHNPTGFTVWLAGGGVKPGIAYGETDDYGHQAVDGKVHMHDLHATILHQLGLDHEQLTYRYAGRDFRLTDVEGRIVRDILA